MTDQETQQHQHLLDAGIRLAGALAGLLHASTVGERSFWNASNEAREALRQWKGICEAEEGDVCPNCGESGGGDDPHLRCPECHGLGRIGS